jgi:hypothetical protein
MSVQKMSSGYDLVWNNIGLLRMTCARQLER